MKVFAQWQIREAYEYAATGETAVHLHFIVTPSSPYCFRRDVANGLPIAHILSQDAELLEALAARHGVKRIVIEGRGTYRQHVDLCGVPLKELLAEMGEDITQYARGLP